MLDLAHCEISNFTIRRSLATSATNWSCRFHVQHARILIIWRASHETCVRNCMQCLEAPMA